MRLLKLVPSGDSDDFKLTLEEHGGDNIPPYAILSHCWGASNEEVSYADLNAFSPEILAKPGYDKIWKCMQRAVEDGFEYLWVDTCCIDKSSSAELSEGINSMFAWYRDATVCYAYLEDVSSGFEDPRRSGSEFRASRWFTRGWTLQELIAPRSVVFVAKNWMEIGTKASLVGVVSDITRIDEVVLLQKNHDVMSVSKRMSWAARRQTTRIEDRAYSLLGLFNVNMPTIYGEGKKAFWRLQNEILKVSDDHTLFAYDPLPKPFLAKNGDQEEWREHFQDEYLSGILAESPDQFYGSSDFIQLTERYFRRYRKFGIQKRLPVHQMTNVGFCITLPVLHIQSQEMMERLLPNLRHHNWSPADCDFLAIIACLGRSMAEKSAACIFLTNYTNEENLFENLYQTQYMRVSWGGQSTGEVNLEGLNYGAFEHKQIYIVGHVNQHTEWDPWAQIWYCGKCQFNLTFHPSHIYQVINTAPITLWDKSSFTCQNQGYGVMPNGGIKFRLLDTGEVLFAALGFFMNEPWGYLEICESELHAQEILNAYEKNQEGPLGSRRNLRLDWFAVTSIQNPRRKIIMTLRKDKNPPKVCTVRITCYDE